MRKPKLGRPSRGKKAAADVLSIRLTSMERAEFDRAAKLEGISVSEWVRKICGTEIARDILRANDAGTLAVLKGER